MSQEDQEDDLETKANDVKETEIPEICWHPYKSVKMVKTKKQKFFRCRDCEFDFGHQAFKEQECAHEGPWDLKGSNQHGPRIRCSTCGTLLLANSQKNLRYVITTS